MYELIFAKGWDRFFKKFDNSEKERIRKRLNLLKKLEKARHLHGLPFFVLESGQYRICFEEFGNSRTILFVGNHKQYEQWYQK